MSVKPYFLMVASVTVLLSLSVSGVRCYPSAEDEQLIRRISRATPANAATAPREALPPLLPPPSSSGSTAASLNQETLKGESSYGYGYAYPYYGYYYPRYYAYGYGYPYYSYYSHYWGWPYYR